MSTAYYALENENGNRKVLSLAVGNNIVAKQVNGIGVDLAIASANFKNGFFTLTEEYPTETELIVTADIIADAFTEYRNLTDYIFNAQELYFVYAPESTEYKRKVKFESITKSNRSAAGTMRCVLNLFCLTPWFTVQTLSGTSVSVTALGQLPTAFEISGSNDSSWMGDVVAASGIGKVTIGNSAAEGSTFALSTIPGQRSVTIDGTNILQYISVVNNEPFFTLQPGATTTVSSTMLTGMTVKAYHFWRAV